MKDLEAECKSGKRKRRCPMCGKRMLVVGVYYDVRRDKSTVSVTFKCKRGCDFHAKTKW